MQGKCEFKNSSGKIPKFSSGKIPKFSQRNVWFQGRNPQKYGCFQISVNTAKNTIENYAAQGNPLELIQGLTRMFREFCHNTHKNDSISILLARIKSYSI